MGLRSSPVRLSIWTVCLLLLHISSAHAARTVALAWSADDVRLQPVGATYGGEPMLGVEMPGAWSRALPGSPDLPWVSVTVALGRTEAVRAWTFEPHGWEMLRDGVVVAPAVDQEVFARDGEPEWVPDPAVYQGSAVVPADAARYLGTQSKAGVVTAHFLVNPFRWNPGTRLLEMCAGGRLVIETETAGEDRFLSAPLRGAHLPALASGLSLATAPGAIGARSSGSIARPPQVYDLSGLGETDAPSLEGTPVEFLLVTTEQFAPAFQELIDWKNRIGSPAALRTVEWIYDHYPHGVDKADKIRLFLRDAYLFWGTRTVVMGGDPAYVPGRYAQDYSWNATTGGMPIITDLYYACLDGNWNANGNSLYGEPPVTIPLGGGQFIVIESDFADLRPELRVGRISAASLADVQTYIRKYREYAMEPPQDPYLREVLLMGEVLFHGDWRLGDCDECGVGCPPNVPCVSDDGANDCITFVDQMGSGPVGGNLRFSELYERDYWWVGQGRPESLPLNLNAVVGKINSGVNVVFHSGHGDRDRLAIGPDRLEATTLRGLNNGVQGKWAGLIYAINCNSAAIDYDCAAEGWQFSQNGGGLIYIGSTNLDFPNSARKMQALTFNEWPGDGTTTPGDGFFVAADSVGQTVTEVRNPDRFVLFSLAFLGDPDMVVWTDVPGTMTVGYDTEIPLGGGATSVSVLRGGLPVSGARVAFYKEGDAMASAFTGIDGIAEFVFRPTTPGEFSVTVTHPNAMPFEATGEVVTTANRPFVALRTFAIDDVTDEQAGISGNGNGLLDIGETVGLDLEFENRGTAAVANLSAILEASTPGQDVELELLDGSESLGALGVGASGSRDRAFRLYARSTPGGRLGEEAVPLEIVWNQDGIVTREEIRPNVYRPRIVMYQTTVEELDGDGDGIPEAGEEYQVSMEFLNVGRGTVHGIQARIQEVIPNRVQIFPNARPLSPAGPQEHALPDGDYQVNFLWSFGIELILYIEDVSDPENPRIISQRVFDLQKPNPATGLAAQGFRDRIALGWKPPTGTDIYSFRVYRSDTEDGTFAPVGVGLVPRTSAESDSAYYSDEGLPPLTGYFYKVAVIDSSGNESVPTAAVSANTAPGALTGWPVNLAEALVNAPTIEQLDFRGYEVITGTNVIYAFTANGGDYHDGDDTESTRGVLTREDDGYKFEGKPAVHDIDGDGRKEILTIATFPDRIAQRALNMICFDNRGAVKWKRPMGQTKTLSSPAIGDVDGDGDLEVVALAGTSVWVFHHDGRPFSGAGNIRTLPGTDAFFLYGSVALADVYNGPEAGALEIIFTTRPPTTNGGKLHVIRALGGGQDIPGFPFVYANHGAAFDNSNASPAIVDINPTLETNPRLGEIFVTTGRDLWAIDPSAATPLLWKREVGIYASIELNSSPAVGDLDRDGDWEVVVGGAGGRLFALEAATGNPVPGFGSGQQPYLQISSPQATMGSPIIGDITGDDFPEILIGDNTGLVHAYDRNGQLIRGFPYVNGGVVGAGLAIWDLNKDGTTDLVIQAGQVLPLTVLEFPGTTFNHVAPDLGRYPWTQFRHDARNTGSISSPPVTPLALAAPDLEVVGPRRVALRWLAEEGFSRFELHRREARFEEWETVGSWDPIDVRAPEGGYRLVDEVPEFATYVYRLAGVEPDGYVVLTAEQSITVSAAALQFALGPVRPNPSATECALELSLPGATKGRVIVVDPGGRIVRTLADGTLQAGVLQLSWDGRDERGENLGAGVYFVRAETDRFGERSNKLIRLR